LLGLRKEKFYSGNFEEGNGFLYGWNKTVTSAFASTFENIRSCSRNTEVVKLKRKIYYKY
jgi:hypothetical protein